MSMVTDSVRRPRATVIMDEGWRSFGLCRDAGVDMVPDTQIENREAQLVCHGCPVQQDCLQHAMDLLRTWGPGQVQGVWGGLTADERVLVASGRHRAPCSICAIDCVPAGGDSRCWLCSKSSTAAPVAGAEAAAGRLPIATQRRAFARLLADGLTIREASEQLGYSTSTGRDACRRWGLKALPSSTPGARLKAQRPLIEQLLAQGQTLTQVARELGFVDNTLRGACKRWGVRVAGKWEVVQPCGTTAARKRHARAGQDWRACLTCRTPIGRRKPAAKSG